MRFAARWHVVTGYRIRDQFGEAQATGPLWPVARSFSGSCISGGSNTSHKLFGCATNAGTMVTRPNSRWGIDCATILINIADWVHRRGARSDKRTLEGL